MATQVEVKRKTAVAMRVGAWPPNPRALRLAKDLEEDDFFLPADDVEEGGTAS